MESAIHYNDITWFQQCLESPPTQLCAQQLVEAKNKGKWMACTIGPCWETAGNQIGPFPYEGLQVQ